jgi:release factor glutamine methyltransferase
MSSVSSQRPNISQLVRGGEVELVVNSVPNARRNAEWMLAHVLECRAAELYVDTSREPSAEQVRLYKALLKRRAGHEPLQYILESTEFMSLPFQTMRDVFIPRPDTECVVEHAETMLAAAVEGKPVQEPQPDAAHILDLCCGSGVIAVSLLKRLPTCTATAVDLNAGAVALTERNAALNGVRDRIDCVYGDAFEFLESTLSIFDMIVCNPPYIPTGELEALPPEVRLHEPEASLDGGADGLDFYRTACAIAATAMSPGAPIVFEIGDAQGAAVSALFDAASFVDIRVRQDYAGCDRVVAARRAVAES